jgi:hypothetical protein
MNEWVQSSGGMTLTGESWSTGRKTHTSDTLSTTNPSLTGLEPKQDLWGEGPATNRLSHVTALKSAADDDYNALIL